MYSFNNQIKKSQTALFLFQKFAYQLFFFISIGLITHRKIESGAFIYYTFEMRKGVKADERLPFEELFFDATFEIPLTQEKAGIFQKPVKRRNRKPVGACCAVCRYRRGAGICDLLLYPLYTGGF